MSAYSVFGDMKNSITFIIDHTDMYFVNVQMTLNRIPLSDIAARHRISCQKRISFMLITQTNATLSGIVLLFFI